MPTYQTAQRDEALPYYYGLNYDAPLEGAATDQRQVGRALGGAFLREAVGVDNGLWYEKITGTPMRQFMVDFGGDKEPDVFEGDDISERVKVLVEKFGDMGAGEILAELLK